MKCLLLAAAALVTLLAASHVVIAAGEREAVIRALENVAAELGRNGRALRWGSIETGGGSSPRM